MAAALTCIGAQAFPDKTIRIIVTPAAGDRKDVWGRIFAARLSHRLGPPELVENRPVANTQLGANAEAKVEPDGYKLLFTSENDLQAITQEPDFKREWGERDLGVTWRGPKEVSQDIRADIETQTDRQHAWHQTSISLTASDHGTFGISL